MATEKAPPQAKQLVRGLEYIVVEGKRNETMFLASVARGLLDSYGRLTETN